VRKIFEYEPFIKFDKKFLKTKEARSKLPLVMAYLRINGAINGNVGISINLIVEKIGYKPDIHKNKINSKVIGELLWLQQHNHIYIMANTDNIKGNDCFIIQINKDCNIFEPEKDFVILTEAEFNIITQTETTCDKQDLLNVFLNIKKFMSFDKVSANLCYPSHTTLCNDCKISSTGAMNNIVKELIDIKVLYTYNSGRYIDNKENIRYANSFYSVEEKELNPHSCDEIIRNYYSSQGIIVERFIK
jgi:hypothetical protein